MYVYVCVCIHLEKKIIILYVPTLSICGKLSKHGIKLRKVDPADRRNLDSQRSYAIGDVARCFMQHKLMQTRTY